MTAAVPPRRRAFVVMASTTGGTAADLAGAARLKAESLGMGTKVLRTGRVRVQGDGWDRTAELLAPEHAAGLYRALHEARCLILSVASALWVRRDPSRDPPVRRAATHLEDFVRHKGLYRLIRDPRSLAAAFDSFNRLTTSSGCTGDDDPRVIPFPTFTTDLPVENLSTEGGRRAFRARYGQARKMIDARRLRWEVGPPHGREQLWVANVPLSRGFHWDVSASSDLAMFTPNEVWKLKPPAYLNVDPDTRVRKTRAGSRAKQVWPR